MVRSTTAIRHLVKKVRNEATLVSEGRNLGHHHGEAAIVLEMLSGLDPGGKEVARVVWV